MISHQEIQTHLRDQERDGDAGKEVGKVNWRHVSSMLAKRKAGARHQIKTKKTKQRQQAFSRHRALAEHAACVSEAVSQGLSIQWRE